MPYGIQQAAISGQISQLEEYLGTALFQRRPFSLTPPGVKLYNFIRPFFDRLDPMGEEISAAAPRNAFASALPKSSCAISGPEFFGRPASNFPS